MKINCDNRRELLYEASTLKEYKINIKTGIIICEYSKHKDETHKEIAATYDVETAYSDIT